MSEMKDKSDPNLIRGVDLPATLDCAHVIPHFLGEASETSKEVQAIS